MEKISWTDRVRNEEVLSRGEEHPAYNKRRKANCIGHVLRRNGLLKHIIEGKVEGGLKVMGRQERKRTQLLGNLRETRGY